MVFILLNGADYGKNVAVAFAFPGVTLFEILNVIRRNRTKRLVPCQSYSAG